MDNVTRSLASALDLAEFEIPVNERLLSAESEARLIRIADIIIASLALVCFLPLMLFIALAIFVTDPGPIMFVHRRIGKGGKTFGCIKFRTMVCNADERLQELLKTCPQSRIQWQRDHKLVNDPRIISIGAFLRKSSLDELPQLFNVLRGEMSLVGPRPIVAAEIPRYGRYFIHYCSMKPGITGLWQVSGRNATTYQRRVALDTVFSQTFCLKIYLKILFATIPVIVLAKGAR